MKRLRSKLTYANIVSTLCLFIVLGGVGYAAVKVPKDSIGAKQIKTGAVRSAEVKDLSIGLNDLATGILPAAHQGERGLPGPEGPPGEPGTPATQIFAFVRTGFCCGGTPKVLPTPTLKNAHGVIAASVAGTGEYEVKFDTALLPGGDVKNCVPVVTEGSADAATPVPGEISVGHPGGIPPDRLVVYFRNSAGTAFTELGSGGGSDGFGIALLC